MLRCVVTNTLFVPERYTLIGHARQTPGPFHTTCISYQGHRLSWFSLSYTAWLEVVARIIICYTAWLEVVARIIIIIIIIIIVNFILFEYFISA